jgi:hypothetical protein
MRRTFSTSSILALATACATLIATPAAAQVTGDTDTPEAAGYSAFGRDHQ